MRDLIDIICESMSATGKVVSTNVLVKRFGGAVMTYQELPAPAQKALTQWMVHEGDNPTYKRSHYGYVEVPVSDLMGIIWNQNGEGISFEDFWGEPGGMNPKTYNEIWPLIWGRDGWEDGMHRLSHYLELGLKMIPVVGTR